MTDYIWNLFVTLVISAVPVIELRGAIPYALGNNIPWQLALITAVVGNMLPVPFILLFLRKVFEWLSKFKLTAPLVDWLERVARKKSRTVIKYAVIGLIILVAIPLPGTGAWTGALVASVLDIRLKTAVPAIFCGVVIAGIVVTALSLGAIHVFGL